MFCVALVFLVEDQYLKSLNGFASKSKLSNSGSGTTSFFGLSKELGLKSVHPARHLYTSLPHVHILKRLVLKKNPPKMAVNSGRYLKNQPAMDLKKIDRKRNVFIFTIAQLFA